MRGHLVRLASLLIPFTFSVAPFIGVAGSVQGQTVVHYRLASPGLDYVRLFGGAGSEQNAVLALGSRSNVFLAGTTFSRDWPVAWKSLCHLQVCPHAFVLKLEPDGARAFFRLSLGGSRATYVSAITVDAAGNAYVTGRTTSPNFPTVRPLQARCGSPGANCDDGFVVKISPRGTLLYSTFLGGRGQDSPSSIALDRHGDIYIAGQTSSPNFPTAKATQRHLGGRTDGFVTKLDPGGKHLLYSTYLGGSKEDSITGIAVGRLGEAYVTGATDSPNFRTSSHSLQPHFIGGDCNFFPCSDAFVVKLGTAGRYLAGSFIATPGDESSHTIALDNSGNVYLAGDTSNGRIPSATAVTPIGKVLCGSEGVVATCESAFVLALTPALDHLLYSRILGGDGLDSANDLAVNATGNVVVAGYTESTNFPTVNPVQAATGGGECPEVKGATVPCDGFVAIIAPHNRSIRFSTYLGGNGSDDISSVALDGHGNAYLAGTTASNNFPSSTTVALPKVFLSRIDGLYR